METIFSGKYASLSHTYGGAVMPPITLVPIVWADSKTTVETEEFQISPSLIGTDRESQQTKTEGFDIVVQSKELLFASWVKQWHKERGITSSISDMIACPSHLKIIALGEQALPLILTQIKREGDDPDHWFVALEAITGENPVPEDAYGDSVKMAKAWLLWAKERNVW